MSDKYSGLTTEMRNEATFQLDTMTNLEIVTLMNQEDKKVAFAVEKALAPISQAVDLIHRSMETGGRLFYFGAGTSGRLGVLDASECPPTFGTQPELIQGVIAGGISALIKSVEGAEDHPEFGMEDVRKYGVEAGDVVVGIAASGTTPYVQGVLSEAKKIGAHTVLVSCNSDPLINLDTDVVISVVVGPEVLSGSTRLKSGTAQKMVLNMLTTATMIRLGKVYGNLMVNVQATNHKLQDRVKRIVMELTDATYEEADKLIKQAHGDAKVAVIMRKKGISSAEAVQLLREADGKIRPILESSP
jgi:N-acetylmuramic acid 6-phosphate etherase